MVYWCSVLCKLLSCLGIHLQVTGQVDPDYLESKLAEVIPGVIRGYSHSESSVRKASVFCLVAIHAVVGDTLKQHLQKLSSSQVSGCGLLPCQ